MRKTELNVGQNGIRWKRNVVMREKSEKGVQKIKRINLTIKRGWQDSQVSRVGGEGPGVAGSGGNVH